MDGSTEAVEAAPTALILDAGDGRVYDAFGVSITFKTTGVDSNGQWLVLEYVAPPRFGGPPPHVHRVTTELFYVVKGTMTLTTDGETVSTGPGGYAFVPPGTVHAFSNPSEEPVTFLVIASPAGLELYFEELAALMREEPHWPPADMGKVVALMEKYDTYPPAGG
jgi:mannose-6-phosphate isomerase-like protein (cupin superfamily)